MAAVFRPHVAQRIKRIIDVVIASLTLIVTAPVLLLAAGLVRLISPGPVLFSQVRLGLRQRAFAMYKLRTMVVNSDDQLARYLAANEGEREEWRKYRRLRADPRIVPHVGRAIRRLSIDELPQLWNVLAGDMSLVGPRPLEVDLLDEFGPAHLECRSRVRPGMTGLWQVSGRSDIDLNRMIEIDEAYVTNWSLMTDLSILAQTPIAVVSRRGAF
jgi:lipopolysaccharide/colanic/teichoic acid biosynthesis glycosyltransferase